MVKKILSVFAIASMMLATSCSNDEFDSIQTGNEATVSFTAQLPDGLQTKSRAYGNGKTAKNLQYAVYEVNDENWSHVNLDGTATFTDLKTTVNLRLVNGKTYNVVFWASANESPYTFNATENDVTVTANYNGITSNEESLDAFFAVETITVTGAASKDVKLKRPFAQLNIGTADLEQAENAGINVAEAGINVSTYKSFDFKTQDVTGTAESVTFGNSNLPTNETFPIEGYKYLTMNYLLMPKDKQTVDVTLNCDGVESRTFQNVPLQRNYRTNIYGNLLTSQNDFNVEITPGFDGEYNNTNDAKGLEYAAENGGEITLSENITLDMALTVSKDLVINLNGFNITANNGKLQIANHIAALISAQGATVTINGNGEINGVKGNTYAVEARGEGSKAIINGGTYVGSSTAAYAIYGGNVEINGGIFSQSGWTNNNYVLNLKDNTNSSIEVTGGKFYGFNPADNAAEGSGTNFMKEGYVSTKISENPDVYVVTKVAATTSDALNAAIKNGGSIYVAEKGLKITAANVENCEFYGYPLYVEGKTAFKNVTFNNATDGLNGVSLPSAIYVTGTSTDVKNVSFESCTFEDAVWDGIQVTNPNLESISFKNCVFVNRDLLTPSDFGVDNLNRRYIHLQTNQEVDTRVEITGCTFTNVSLDYCPGSAVCIYGYKTDNMTINNNIVKGAGANNLTTDMIWISNGYTNNLWTVEQIKAAFVAK